MDQDRYDEYRRADLAGAAYVGKGIAWQEHYRDEQDRAEVGPDKERFTWQSSWVADPRNKNKVRSSSFGTELDARAVLERDRRDQPFRLTYEGRWKNPELAAFTPDEIKRIRASHTHEYQLRSGTTKEALKEACDLVAAHETQYFRDQAMSRFRPDPVEMEKGHGYER